MKPGRPITDRSAKGRQRRKRYSDRVEAGLCGGCGKLAEGGFVLCPGCRGTTTAALASLRETRRAAGLCQECGQDSDGKSRCPACVKRRNNRPSRTYAHRWKTEYRWRTR